MRYMPEGGLERKAEGHSSLEQTPTLSQYRIASALSMSDRKVEVEQALSRHPATPFAMTSGQ